jgi:glutaredoxin
MGRDKARPSDKPWRNFLMSTPILYVKSGCPYCAAAMKYLDDHKVAYEKTDVRGNETAMDKLKNVSGQTRTPTLVRDGEVLADFGIEDLEKFLAPL